MTSPSPEVKPLPCPACGSSTAQRAVAAPLWQIVCDLRDGGCGLSSRYADTREEAVLYWNRRRELESRVSPGAAPNFAQMLSDFGEQERVFRPYASEYHAGNVNLQITDAVRDHLTAFVGFLTRRFAEYAGHQTVTQNNASVSSVTAPSSAPEEATDDGADRFAKWFIENYPSGTEITVPAWHASKIFRAAQGASRSSGEDQPAATDEIAALKRRAEAAEEDWQIAETEVASLKQQVIDSALRAERLEADRTALIEGKVRIPTTSHFGLWYVDGLDDKAFTSPDEALAAYRASLSPQPAPPCTCHNPLFAAVQCEKENGHAMPHVGHDRIGRRVTWWNNSPASPQPVPQENVSDG